MPATRVMATERLARAKPTRASQLFQAEACEALGAWKNSGAVVPWFFVVTIRNDFSQVYENHLIEWVINYGIVL